LFWRKRFSEEPQVDSEEKMLKIKFEKWKIIGILEKKLGYRKK
jgi:hypothetical protein